ncbi:hypothetical protein D3C78_1916060 [compost metagenome]
MTLTYKRKQAIWLGIIGGAALVFLLGMMAKAHAEKRAEFCNKYPLACQEQLK